MSGLHVVNLPTASDGGIDLDELDARLGPDVAAIMLTLPSTLGLFERRIIDVIERVHSVGAQVYCDGANMNAMLGRVRPADLGVDVMHLNLHKTFSTPHGGGGPGAGPICSRMPLDPYLPSPIINKTDNSSGEYFSLSTPPKSIGRMSAHHGNFGVLVRAYTYLRTLGDAGLKQVSENAVLNANYILHHLKTHYLLPFDRPCMHEVVLSANSHKASGIRGLEIAKRLLDYGFHAPTMYFPLTVLSLIHI